MLNGLCVLLLGVGTLGQSDVVPNVRHVVPKAAAYAPPSVRVVAPDEIDTSEIIEIRAEYDDSTPIPNIKMMNYQWLITKDGVPTTAIYPFPDNTRLLISSGKKPAVFTVTLSVNCLFGVDVKVGDKLGIVDYDMMSLKPIPKQIVVKDMDAPTPPPGPGPVVPDVPTPLGNTDYTTPNFAESRFNLEKLIFDFVARKNTTLTRDEKYRFAQALSKGYAATAAQIAAGSPPEMRTPEGILTNSKITNSNKIQESGVPIAKLTDIATAMQGYLKDLNKNSVIQNYEDFQEAAMEVSRGLASIPR